MVLRLPAAGRYLVLSTAQFVQKKRAARKSSPFKKVDLISSRTHQMSSSRSTWNLQLGYPKLVCIQCC